MSPADFRAWQERLGLTQNEVDYNDFLVNTSIALSKDMASDLIEMALKH